MFHNSTTTFVKVNPELWKIHRAKLEVGGFGRFIGEYLRMNKVIEGQSNPSIIEMSELSALELMQLQQQVEEGYQ